VAFDRFKDLFNVEIKDEVRGQAVVLAAQGIDLGALMGGAGTAAGLQPAADAGDAIDEQLERLQKLGELRDAGVITEEEFAAKKAEILGGDR
jgi:hypothetical protein